MGFKPEDDYEFQTMNIKYQMCSIFKCFSIPLTDIALMGTEGQTDSHLPQPIHIFCLMEGLLKVISNLPEGVYMCDKLSIGIRHLLICNFLRVFIHQNEELCF